ncbi:hypothetical protein IE53DRAFT_17830 [Violaceomyces palustris]|uniref:Uncharacterized protein n=1 Tax=Violaceomyces palustris TaxID=1673888 RepID=A0ACD0NLF8_9BASI|nr:hypothetical protein IE53DRAFT_17830 [Violaceomyces palustris]
MMISTAKEGPRNPFLLLFHVPFPRRPPFPLRLAIRHVQSLSPLVSTVNPLTTQGCTIPPPRIAITVLTPLPMSCKNTLRSLPPTSLSLSPHATCFPSEENVRLDLLSRFYLGFQKGVGGGKTSRILHFSSPFYFSGSYQRGTVLWREVVVSKGGGGGGQTLTTSKQG